MLKTSSLIPKKVASKQLLNRDRFVSIFDKMFDDMFKEQFPNVYTDFGIHMFEHSSFPKVNVIDNEKTLEIQAELAGYNKDDILIKTESLGGYEGEQNLLTISGKSSQLSEQTDKSVYLIRELKRSSFTRSFRLSAQLDVNNIDASFENGILKIIINKLIPIKTDTSIKTVTIRD